MCVFYYHIIKKNIIQNKRLGDQSGSSGGFVSEVRCQLSGSSVISSKSVDSGLNQNKSVLGVLVLAVSLQMLSDLDGLLDKHVKILWDFWGKSSSLKDSKDLDSGDGRDGGNTVGIS